MPTNKETLYLTIAAGDLARLNALYKDLRQRRLIPQKLTLNQWALQLLMERADQVRAALQQE
jgi:hypothetical protein